MEATAHSKMEYQRGERVNAEWSRREKCKGKGRVKTQVSVEGKGHGP